MPDTLLLQVVSPERRLVDEQVSQVQVPALDGFIGVLPGHARLLSELKPGGVLCYRADGQDKVLAIYGGFVEVLPDRVRVIADGAEAGSEIDLQEAHKRLDVALKQLEAPPGAIPDPAEVLDEVLRSRARVEVAEKKS